MLLFLIGFSITWAPSLIIRRWVFKEAVPWWAGALIAFVTLLLGMVVGSLLTGQPRPAIHGAAAVCAYFTVTRQGSKKEED